MTTLKWYRSRRAIDDTLTLKLIDAIKRYYTNETVSDQTKLYTALGNYYIKTTDFNRLLPYLANVIFEECDKPSRKHLSPL